MTASLHLTTATGTALLLLGVSHAAAGLVLLLDAALVTGEQRLAVLGLLVLLRNVAAAAAARRGEVDEAAALQVVLGAQVGALQGREADVARHAARGAEEEALRRGTVLAHDQPRSEGEEDIPRC